MKIEIDNPKFKKIKSINLNSENFTCKRCFVSYANTATFIILSVTAQNTKQIIANQERIRIQQFQLSLSNKNKRDMLRIQKSFQWKNFLIIDHALKNIPCVEEPIIIEELSFCDI